MYGNSTNKTFRLLVAEQPARRRMQNMYGGEEKMYGANLKFLTAKGLTSETNDEKEEI